MHYLCKTLFCREQLIRCREHLDQLLAQCDSLEKKIVHHDRQEQERGQVEEEEEGKISVASVGLFQSQLGKVRREIAAEEEIEKGIEDKLQVVTAGTWFNSSKSSDMKGKTHCKCGWSHSYCGFLQKVTYYGLGHC